MPEQSTINPLLKGSLLSLLSLMVNKATSRDLQPVIRTRRLLDLLRTSGVSISYGQLQALTSDPTIGNFIQSVDPNTVTLRMPDDNDLDLPVDDTEPALGQESDQELPGEDVTPTEELPPIQDMNNSGETTTINHTAPSVISAMASRALKRR